MRLSIDCGHFAQGMQEAGMSCRGVWATLWARGGSQVKYLLKEYLRGPLGDTHTEETSTAVLQRSQEL